MRIYLLNIFLDIKKGYYDIGCNLPKADHYFLLYKAGWKGIKIDISKRSIDLNKIIRKRILI